MIIDMRIGLIW